MKQLPIGRQTFSELILANELYIDKTEIAYELITTYRYAFLSRPRRFGKSLLMSTIKEIFEGNKKLFEGLDIYNKWDWEDTYPVIKIDFNGDLRSSKNLKNRIHDILVNNQKNLQVECKKMEEFDSCFEELIRNCYEKYILDYPNLEVKMSFNNYILNYFITQIGQKSEVENGLIDMLEIANLDGLEQVLKSLFASIAYNNFTNNYIENYEGFYASVFYAYFAGAGFDKIVAEAVTNGGRIDLSVFIDDKVYIFEFKVNQKGALEQIRAKNYHQRYLANFNEVYLIGVEFDSKQRNVVGYEWERV